MPLKNFETVGILQGYEYLRGTITAIDRVTDTCDLAAKELKPYSEQGYTFQDTAYADVPIYYHCKADKTERENGAITGGSWAFANGDEVIVLRQRAGAPAFENKIFVIGHPDGARRCAPVILVYSTQSGEESVAWDIINDEYLIEVDQVNTVLGLLTDMGVTEQTLCEPSLMPSQCYSIWLEKPDIPGSYYTPMGYQTAADLPVCIINANATSGQAPFINSILVDIHGGLAELNGGDCTGASVYGWEQPYMIDPVITRDQTPWPGMWLDTHRGVMTSATWDEEAWGRPCPLSANQRYWLSTEQTMMWVRSVFDHDFSGGYWRPKRPAPGGGWLPQELVTELLVSALDEAATPLFIATRDADYYHIDTDVNLTVWLEAGFTQDAYDWYMGLTEDYLEKSVNPFHLLLYHDPMLDFTTGLATNNETSLLFEFMGIYPNKYEFFEAGQVMDETMLAKYILDLKIFYRHPYPKKNVDAVLFKLVNDERENLSLEKLEWNWNLYNAAQLFSDDMANRKDKEPLHIGSDGSSIVERIDNAFYGYEYIEEPASVFGVPLDPPRTKGRTENVHASTIGLKVPLVSVVDNTVEGETTRSHTTDGDLIDTTTIGWKQSAEHWGVITTPEARETGIATRKGLDGKTYITQTFGYLGDETYMWPGFSTFDPTKLIAYINEHFTFNEDPLDTRRKPKVYLCTIPQD